MTALAPPLPATESFLQINGFTQTLGDWTLDATVQAAMPNLPTVERECEENHDSRAAVPQDLVDATIHGAYSFGGATLWDETGQLRAVHRDMGSKRLLIAMLIVPDWAKGQFMGTFTAPANYEKAICFQIEHAFPCSKPFGNPDAIWLDINDPDIKAKILTGPRVININCRSLWPAFANPVDMHTKTDNHPAVVALCLWLIQQAAAGAFRPIISSPPISSRHPAG